MTLTINQNSTTYSNENFNEIKYDPINILPDELVLEVFSRLTLATLGAICSISKEWERLASDPILLKKTIYREIAFGNAKWAQCFGKDAIKEEDNKEEWSSLPWKDFIEDCKKFKSLFPEKQAKDTLMLIRLPKTLNGQLTLKSFGKLAKKYFPHLKEGTCFMILPHILDKLGDLSIDKSRWVLMTKDVLPGTRNKSYHKQKKIIAELARKALINYEVPGTLESVICILSQYLDSKTCLFNKNPYTTTITRCKEKLAGDQIIVGSFNQWALPIHFRCDYNDCNSIGVAALREF